MNNNSKLNKTSDDIKRMLLKHIYFSNNESIYKLYSYYRKYKELTKKEGNPHVDHKRKIIFIHNPKTGGTSIRKIFKFPKEDSGYSHFTPTFLVTPKLWEEYYTFVAIRNPLERIISAYFYLTDKKYLGYYYRIYPFIHSLTISSFFHLFKNEPFAIIPQHEYIRHHFSNKKIDYIIRFDNFKNDVNKLNKILKNSHPKNSLPHLNKGKYHKKLIIPNKLKEEIFNYYKKDYKMFGYKKI